ncbi:MAG TPA: 50S ribosomal protein L15e [archaeon]|nr:50S ribosomal protein L15e [archaeon]
MTLAKRLEQTWKNAAKPAIQERHIAWRRQPVVMRLESPSRPLRARALGYKAKQGITVVRIRVKAGGRTRPSFHAGRKPSKRGRLTYYPKKSLQMVAEEKASRKHPNMEVMGSYWVGGDSINTWYEALLIDRVHPAIKKDAQLKWVTQGTHKGRAARGLTAAGKKLKHQ